MLSLLFGQGRQVDAVSDEGDDKENDGLLRQRTEEAFRVLSSFILGARELGTTMDSIPASTVEIIFTSLSDFSGTIRQYPPATHTLRQAIARADDETLHAAIRRCIEALDGVWKVEGLAEMEVLDRIGGFATLLVVLVCSRPERMAPGMVSQALMAILNVMTSEGLVELSGEDPNAVAWPLGTPDLIEDYEGDVASLLMSLCRSFLLISLHCCPLESPAGEGSGVVLGRFAHCFLTLLVDNHTAVAAEGRECAIGEVAAMVTRVALVLMDTGPTDDDGEAADGLVSYSPQLGEARRFGGPRVAPLVRAMNEVLAVDPTRGEDLWTALLAALESEDEVIAGQGDGASLWKASEACTFSSEAVVLSWLLLSQCEGFYRGVFPYTRQPRGPPDGLEQGNASPSPARLFLPVVGLINRIVKALAEAGEEEEGHDESRIPRKVADALLEGSPSEGYRTLLPALVGLLVIITEDRGSVVVLRKCEFSKIHARRLSEGGMISLAPFEGGSLLDVLVVASLRFMPYMPDASMALAASICNVCPYLYSIPAFTAEKLEEALRKSIKAAANGRPRGEEIAGLLSEGVAALLLWNYRECTPLVLAMLSHSEAYDASLGLEGRALLEGPLGVIRTVVEVSEEAVGEGLEEDDISHDDILDVVPETLVGLLPITQAIVLRQHSSRVKANEVITFLALCLGEDEEEPLRDIVLWLQHSPELETTERGYNISYGTDVAALMEHVAVEGAKADLDRLNEEVKGLSKRLTWEEERLLAVREEKGRAVALEDYHRAGELKGEEERLLLSIGHLKSLGLPEHT